jgi:hypothetical protein
VAQAFVVDMSPWELLGLRDQQLYVPGEGLGSALLFDTRIGEASVWLICTLDLPL